MLVHLRARRERRYSHRARSRLRSRHPDNRGGLGDGLALGDVLLQLRDARILRVGLRAKRRDLQARRLHLADQTVVAAPGPRSAAELARQPTAGVRRRRRSRRLGRGLPQHLGLAPQLVDLLDERHVLVHQRHVVLLVRLDVLRELALELIDGLLQVLSLAIVLALDVLVGGLVVDLLRHVLRVQGLDLLGESLGRLDVFRGLVEILLERMNCRVPVLNRLLLALDVLAHPEELVAKVLDGEVEVGVALVVPLQLLVHLSDLILHIRDVLLAGFDSPLELLDLEVEDKLELLQLLVLLLQVVDSLLLVPDRLVPVPDLALKARDVLLQICDCGVQVLLIGEETGNLVLLLRDALLHGGKLFLHDAVLALQPQRHVALFLEP